VDLVDVDVFRMQIQRMGAARPRIALFVSQDDEALSLSGKIWGGVGRLGDVDPTQEPYRSEFELDKILVFNLTGLASPGDNAHDRAFQDVTSVMGMIKRRPSDDRASVRHRRATRTGDGSGQVAIGWCPGTIIGRTVPKVDKYEAPYFYGLSENDASSYSWLLAIMRLPYTGTDYSACKTPDR